MFKLSFLKAIILRVLQFYAKLRPESKVAKFFNKYKKFSFICFFIDGSFIDFFERLHDLDFFKNSMNADNSNDSDNDSFSSGSDSGSFGHNSPQASSSGTQDEASSSVIQGEASSSIIQDEPESSSTRHRGDTPMPDIREEGSSGSDTARASSAESEETNYDKFIPRNDDYNEPYTQSADAVEAEVGDATTLNAAISSSNINQKWFNRFNNHSENFTLGAHNQVQNINSEIFRKVEGDKNIAYLERHKRELRITAKYADRFNLVKAKFQERVANEGFDNISDSDKRRYVRRQLHNLIFIRGSQSESPTVNAKGRTSIVDMVKEMNEKDD